MTSPAMYICREHEQPSATGTASPKRQHSYARRTQQAFGAKAEREGNFFALAYESGLGEKNSLGFGMIEAL